MSEAATEVLEWVKVDLPAGTTRADALAFYETTAPLWASNPDPIAKTYVFDESGPTGGDLYVSRSRDVAERWHGADNRHMIETRYGSEPRIRLADALLDIVDGTIRRP